MSMQHSLTGSCASNLTQVSQSGKLDAQSIGNTPSATWQFLADDFKTQYCSANTNATLNNAKIGETVSYQIGNYWYSATKTNQYYVLQINNTTQERRRLQSSVLDAFTTNVGDDAIIQKIKSLGADAPNQIRQWWFSNEYGVEVVLSLVLCEQLNNLKVGESIMHYKVNYYMYNFHRYSADVAIQVNAITGTTRQLHRKPLAPKLWVFWGDNQVVYEVDKFLSSHLSALKIGESVSYQIGSTPYKATICADDKNCTYALQTNLSTQTQRRLTPVGPHEYASYLQFRSGGAHQQHTQSSFTTMAPAQTSNPFASQHAANTLVAGTTGTAGPTNTVATTGTIGANGANGAYGSAGTTHTAQTKQNGAVTTGTVNNGTSGLSSHNSFGTVATNGTSLGSHHSVHTQINPNAKSSSSTFSTSAASATSVKPAIPAKSSVSATSGSIGNNGNKQHSYTGYNGNNWHSKWFGHQQGNSSKYAKFGGSKHSNLHSNIANYGKASHGFHGFHGSHGSHGSHGFAAGGEKKKEEEEKDKIPIGTSLHLEQSDVYRMFYKTVDKNAYHITGIEDAPDISMEGLYNACLRRARAWKKQHGEDFKNVEKWLFHGTKTSAIQKIMKNGFDRNYNITSGYGVGVYFARDAQYSRSYCQNDTKTHGGDYCMLLCRVIVGDIAKGAYKQKFIPHKKDKITQYETLVDDPDNPTIFVVTRDYHAMPAYKIWFKKRKLN